MKKNNSVENIKRINRVLRTIRSVNQHIVREKDKTGLAKAVCDTLTENRSYYNAWVVLWDGDGNMTTAAESGIGKDFVLMTEKFRAGLPIDCISKSLQQSEVVLTLDPFSECASCPLSHIYAGRGAMTMRLNYADKVLGILCVSIPKNFFSDSEEHELFREVAEDVSFSLNAIDLAEEQKLIKTQMAANIKTLKKRVKELNCLFNVSEILTGEPLSFEEIAQRIVDILPDAFQFPEIACAQIVFENKNFSAKKFRKTKWCITASISSYGKRAGSIAVCYLNKAADAGRSPFQKEEIHLIHSIAERLGNISERFWAENLLSENEKQFGTLVENSPTGISILQKHRVVFQNIEQERLFGPTPRSTIFVDAEKIYLEDVERVKNFYRKLRKKAFKPVDTDFRFFQTEPNSGSNSLKWVYCRACPINYNGKESILLNTVDMTELKALEKLLRIQDKMASLGRVAAGIAHEIRNPLSGINIYLNTLERIYAKSGGTEKIPQIIAQLKSASGKIESVIKRVMDFTRPGRPNFILSDINRSVEAAIELSLVALRKNAIQVEKRLSNGLPKCYLDSHLIEEVILNMINNAAEAMSHMPSGKLIRINSGQNKGSIWVRISDSGPGIDHTIGDKIFDPYYTTKNGGTGIGLNISQRIIKDHDGTIAATGSDLGGAEFIIEIPIKDGARQR